MRTWRPRSLVPLLLVAGAIAGGLTHNADMAGVCAAAAIMAFLLLWED